MGIGRRRLLVLGLGRALGSLALVVCHLPGTKVGFLITTCGEIDWTIQKMTTGEETSLTGQCQWTGAIGTEEGMSFSMKGKDLRGGHRLHLHLHQQHHFAAGLMMLEGGAALQ